MPRDRGAIVKEPPVMGTVSGSFAGSLSGSNVSTFVLAATLSAACAHAAWNSIAHAIPDKVATFTLISLGGIVCSVPLILISASPSPRCYVFLAVSAALHVTYTGALMLSYRLGD